jgi:hypothetical protein
MSAQLPSTEHVGVPFGAMLDRLPPAARTAYHHERRRGHTEIDALISAVVLPEAVENLMMRGRE